MNSINLMRYFFNSKELRGSQGAPTGLSKVLGLPITDAWLSRVHEALAMALRHWDPGPTAISWIGGETAPFRPWVAGLGVEGIRSRP